jgi:hypothetical protein
MAAELLVVHSRFDIVVHLKIRHRVIGLTPLRGGCTGGARDAPFCAASVFNDNSVISASTKVNVTIGPSVQLSKVERGKVAPTLEILLGVATKFGKSLDWIVIRRRQLVGRSKKTVDILLMFVYDRRVRNASHSRFVFSLCPSAAATNVTFVIGIGS